MSDRPGGQPESVLLEDAYLDVTYSESRAPKGDYPALLARRVAEGHLGRPGRLLDFGCGRGDQMAAFAALGFDVVGADVSARAADMAEGFEVAVIDPATSALPYPAASFDYVFSKSVIEHMPTPSDLAREAFRVLRPGGVAVLMTPSWEHNAWGPFYIDHTHVTPFTAPSLKDMLEIAGFADLHAEHFLQLPFVWRRPWLGFVPALVRRLPLRYRPYHENARWPEAANKVIRFSKEVMLLATGRKPS